MDIICTWYNTNTCAGMQICAPSHHLKITLWSCGVESCWDMPFLGRCKRIFIPMPNSGNPFFGNKIRSSPISFLKRNLFFAWLCQWNQIQHQDPQQAAMIFWLLCCLTPKKNSNLKRVAGWCNTWYLPQVDKGTWICDYIGNMKIWSPGSSKQILHVESYLSLSYVQCWNAGVTSFLFWRAMRCLACMAS